MKKIFVIIFFLTAVFNLSAQELGMLAGDPSWSYTYYHQNKPTGAEPVAAIRDELYGLVDAHGQQYHQLFQMEWIDMGVDHFYALVDPVGVREDNGKVYVLREDFVKQVTQRQEHKLLNAVPIPYQQTSENELLLYDFTLQVGDKYPTSADYEDIYVEKVDSVITEDAEIRKLFTLTNGLQILEGVGCLNSRNGPLLYYLFPPESWPRDNESNYYLLSEYKKDDSIIFNGKLSFDNIVRHRVDKDVTSLTPYYTLSGRHLPSLPTRKGIYIKDGRKVLIK